MLGRKSMPGLVRVTIAQSGLLDKWNPNIRSKLTHIDWLATFSHPNKPMFEVRANFLPFIACYHLFGHYGIAQRKLGLGIFLFFQCPNFADLDCLSYKIYQRPYLSVMLFEPESRRKQISNVL